MLQEIYLVFALIPCWVQQKQDWETTLNERGEPNSYIVEFVIIRIQGL
jgi:hypothetical protein